MTNEEQRIAIAEACGWTNIITQWVTHPAGPAGTHPIRKIADWLPDYLNDLNAIAEAVATLNSKDAMEWSSQLCKIVGGGAPPYPHQVHNAIAAQRAEAFLRTLGLWKTDEPAVRLNNGGQQ